MKYKRWLKLGRKHSWVSAPVCLVHDGDPMSEDEFERYHNGDDPCVYILRLYDDEQHRAEVEAFNNSMNGQ